MTALIVLRAPVGWTLHAGRDRLFGTLLRATIALAAVPLRRWSVPDPVLVALLRVAEILLGAATGYMLTMLLPRRRAKTAINGLLGSDVSKELRP